MELYELMSCAQQGNQECCYAIIKKFEKLIKKYARKLSYEDAEEDLICFVVELIQLFPLKNFRRDDEGKIVTYIANSVKNRYFFLLKRMIERKNEICMSEMSQEQQFMAGRKLSFEDSYDTLFFDDIRSLLSEKEAKIKSLKKLKKSYLVSLI